MKIFLGLYCSLLLQLASPVKFKDQAGEFLDKQIKKLSDRKVKCGLKKVTFASLENMRLVNVKDTDSIILCYLQALQDSSFQSSHGHLWSALGTIYKKQGAVNQAATCFKHSQKIQGKITPHIKEWHFIGPFVIGKMEIDGDPLEAYGGIRNVSKYRYQKSARFYSELVPGGEIKWRVDKPYSSDNMVQITAGIDWNDLVNAIGSLGITEWQGWVVGELAVNDKDQNIAVQCQGVSTIYIDDIPVTGDVYHREKYWYGVNLDQGLHTVYIRLRTKVAGKFKCSFRIARPEFEVMSANFMPHLMDGYLFSGYFSLPVANYHFADFLKITKVTLQDVRPSDLNLNMETVHKHEQIAPGQIKFVPFKLSSRDSKLLPQCTDTDSAGDVSFNLKFYTSLGQQSLSMALRCRKFRQSFLFTFLDHDGSVQHAAAIPPLQDCPGGLCPTLLTLHGTTISPQNQADSYKQMVNGEFKFGSQYAWLLAPTRHGAHNWEGPGVLTALTALESLGEITKATDWIANKADTQHVIFAGHSMGGHGAWHVATHYPDRCLGLVSLASWIKKEEYGDSNLFFRHDISTSHADPVIKMIMEACIAENDADRHVPNLQGIPVLARIGANDRTVHPYFVRRMYRLLKEEGVGVNYSEVAGKEHWWWDTSKTNDGGVVNDQTLRDFTNNHVSDHVFSSGSCSSDDCTEQAGGGGNKYKEGAGRNFTLICYNPALGEGVAGVRILQQITPYRQSVIQGHITSEGITLTTINVRRFTISEPANRKVNWHKTFLKVDRSEVFSSEDVKKLLAIEHAHLCKDRGDWKICQEDIYLLGMRGPLNLGPARRIAENPFLIVVGTSDDSSMQQYIIQVAVYIANLFFLTSDTTVSIVKDTELNDEDAGKMNLIIIGNTEENLLTRKYLHTIPVEIKDKTLQIDACVFRHTRMGFLSLVPNGSHKLALLLLGTSREGLSDIVTMATPTIPPMTRSPFSNLVPDYVITGPEFGRKGPGGYLCTGFWGNNWEYRSDISSCVCDL